MIAIATSLTQLPPDDPALLCALDELGIAARIEIWSSPSTDWSQFDVVVVRSCWDYHLRVDEFRHWLRSLQERNVCVLNPLDLIRWNIDKRYLQQLSDKGIAIPGTIWLGPAERADVADVCRKRGWNCEVVKPLISASAYGTERKIEGFENGPLMIQQYLPEIESEGEWSLMYFSGRFSHAVRKRATAGDYRVQSEFGGTAELCTPPHTVRDAADRAMAALPQAPVFARVDLVDADGSVLLMELELIDPELFLTLAPGASRSLAVAIQSAIEMPGI